LSGQPGTEDGARGTSPQPGVRAFVWLVWGLLSLMAVALVAVFGSNIPVWDDYDIIPYEVGERPVTLEWFWEQCNEHRIALPKLILLETQRLAGNDVRAGMLLSTALLSALAAAMIVLAGRFPGGVRATDAVFPILLLHLGHATNLLWGIQFAFVLPTALGSAYLIAIAGRTTWPSPARAALAGVGLVLLPLCGGTGLVLVPALALWLFGAAWSEARSGRPSAGRRAALIALAAVPGLVVTALYFRGFRKGSHPEAEGGLLDNVRTGVQFLTGGVGMPASWWWPLSGVVTIVLIVLALSLLGWIWTLRPEERPRIFGLVAFLTGMLAMAVAVGLGRGWSGPSAGFQERYVTMAVPLWCWLIIVFRLYAPPFLDGLMLNALFATACVLLWPNAEAGLALARGKATMARALARDIHAGAPLYVILRRYSLFLHPSQNEALKLLPMLRRARIGPFRALHDNPRFREERLPTKPAELELARWDAATSTAHVTDVDPQLIYRLPTAPRVAGIRIRYSHHNPEGKPARFQLTWLRPGQREFTDMQRYANWTMPTGEGRETTVWVDDFVSEFRIQPDNQPCEFHIDEIVLLKP
jgi:hypothetical protein